MKQTSIFRGIVWCCVLAYSSGYTIAQTNSKTIAPQTIYNEGIELYDKQDYAAAEQSFGAAAENLPKRQEQSWAHYNRGNTFLQQQNYAQAIEAYKQALRLQPNNSDAQYNLAYAQKKLKQNQNQQKQNQNQQKQNQNQQNQNQNQQNQNQNQQNQNQNQQNQNQQNQNQNQQNQNQNQPNGSAQRVQNQAAAQRLSKQNAARILERMKQEEIGVQRKMLRQKAEKTPPTNGKDW